MHIPPSGLRGCVSSGETGTFSHFGGKLCHKCMAATSSPNSLRPRKGSSRSCSTRAEQEQMSNKCACGGSPGAWYCCPSNYTVRFSVVPGTYNRHAERFMCHTTRIRCMMDRTKTWMPFLWLLNSFVSLGFSAKKNGMAPVQNFWKLSNLMKMCACNMILITFSISKIGARVFLLQEWANKTLFGKKEQRKKDMCYIRKILNWWRKMQSEGASPEQTLRDLARVKVAKSNESKHR